MREIYCEDCDDDAAIPGKRYCAICLPKHGDEDTNYYEYGPQ